MKFNKIELKVIDLFVILLSGIIGAWLCMEKYFILGISICLVGISSVVLNAWYRHRKNVKAISAKQETRKKSLPKKSTNPFKKDEDIGYQINPKTKEVLCNKCLNESGFAVSLDKNKAKVSVNCPRCKTMHMLPFEMLSKEDFTEDSDMPNRRPRKKAMRVSTIERKVVG